MKLLISVVIFLSACASLARGANKVVTTKTSPIGREAEAESESDEVLLRNMNIETKFDDETGLHYYDVEGKSDQEKRLLNTLRLDKLQKNDICDNGDHYGKCDRSKFERCDDDFMMCYHRVPMNNTFYDRKKLHPVFYIDYERAICVPKWNEEKNKYWNCNSCTGHEEDIGKYCYQTGHCMIETTWECYCKKRTSKEKRRFNRKWVKRNCPRDAYRLQTWV